MLARWAGRADWTLLPRTNRDWLLSVPVAGGDDFATAARILLSGFQRARPRPVLRLYPNQVAELLEAGG